MLYEFIDMHRDAIVQRCRAKVATRSHVLPAQAELTRGVPLFLDQLSDALHHGGDGVNPEIAQGALLHGHALLLEGFTVSQVVHDYGDICQAVTELALELDAPISTEEFRTLNRCLDDAIASAVTEFSRGTLASSEEDQTQREHHRMGFFAHELRNLVNTATIAFGALKAGSVGVSGSTAAVVDRSLSGLRTLIARSLAEVRLTQGIQHKEPIALSSFVDQLAAAARMEATARGVSLVITPVEDGLAVVADQHVLSAVVTNLLQNAFKFTRPHTTVVLRVRASAERVLIEVQDECGGLPGGDANIEQLFRPFEQRSADRQGVGIGLAFSRWGAEKNDGRLYARNCDNGCVFTVELPLCPAPALAAT